MIAVKDVETGTLAARVGLEPGDQILAINGEEIEDLVDFQVHSSDPVLHFEVLREGEAYEFAVDRVAGEPVGVTFEDMRLRRCNNKCVFCFLHQMPGGLRRSLYFEDDDYRLSFLHGSYVTLTNVRDRDLQRIVDQGLSPQYISVHATDPAVRQTMLGRRQSTVPILERIDQLAANGIDMHCQVVVCPGHNDGPVLEGTLRDLSARYPAVRSVALVPVGLTRFRRHLPQLQPVTPERAGEYVEQVEIWGQKLAVELGERFVYAADELFLLLGRLPPERSYYDAFPQIENGIGMVRSFLDRWDQTKSTVRSACPDQGLQVALVTGTLGATFLTTMAAEISHPPLRVEAVPVTNDFFGHGISVSGLLTGTDIAARLNEGEWNRAILPPNCINGDGLTLDDMTVPEVESRCGISLSVGDYDLAASLVRCLTGEAGTEDQGRQLAELGFLLGDEP
ncbi:DUF512 domain-containing protein [Candidatus Latescibacterota bacterium]